MLRPVMIPPPEARLVRFVGDRIRFQLRFEGGKLPAGWRARLRTNLGRAALVNEEIIHSHFKKLPLAGATWRDVPMPAHGTEWQLELPVTETGYFKAKPYALDPQGKQHWPGGGDTGISVHPDSYRTANTIYCAFTRMFGPNRTAERTSDPKWEAHLAELDKRGYAVIPPSGKFRDLIRELPHIVGTLGCRILHLLPVNPTPTTYARFGRFGSPYAVQDLTAIDPALVEFDQRRTGVEQFCELTQAAHAQGARVFLDVVINHTGWGSTLQEHHPEWFVRGSDGKFHCPGAWGTVWEDLVELDQRWPALWDEIAEVFLVWCRRGVDGFRCDAGYKVPMVAWQYITAKVRQEFPNAIFLLEGLGGAWEATETLLTEGGMQWAYSELFQNYSGPEVATYLDHSLRQSEQVGLLVHYSETHDNPRLADKGRQWSLLRNSLCALASSSGGFGFTCGVEWLAPERVNVHSNRGLAWGNKTNVIPELARLNRLLAEHPCFFDGAKLTRLSATDSPVYILRRDSAEGLDSVLVLVNTDVQHAHTISVENPFRSETGRARAAKSVDLLGQTAPQLPRLDEADWKLTLPGGAAFCLAPTSQPRGLSCDAYRQARARAAFALQAVSRYLPMEQIGPCDWQQLAGKVDADPARFLAVSSALDPQLAQKDLLTAISAAEERQPFPPVVSWEQSDQRRITPVPPQHWLLVEDKAPFRASLKGAGPVQNVESLRVRDGYIAVFSPSAVSGDAELVVELYQREQQRVTATIRRLAPAPTFDPTAFLHAPQSEPPLVLLTNGIGGMARLCVDLGRIQSKYDCLLGANLHATLPTDRHIFAKRARVWVNGDGFITPLNEQNLVSFEPGPPARWHFIANAGDGRSVAIDLTAEMIEGRNTVLLRFSRPAEPPKIGKDLPAGSDVTLTVRVDLEDRNFHWETKRNGGAEHHFASNTHVLSHPVGFEFKPAFDRQLRVVADAGRYHSEPEWSMNIPHVVEQSRGQEGCGDAYSPGWFDLPLAKGSSVTVTVSADATDPARKGTGAFSLFGRKSPGSDTPEALAQAPEIFPASDAFGRQLLRAARAFVVRRDSGKTVIAGYPWFLDWGRDTLICARGLLAAGWRTEVEQMLIVFGRFEQNGTLPNTIHGEDASNRDTSDAPLFYGLVCEEFAEATKQAGESSADFYALPVDRRGRKIADILRALAVGYIRGTPNGIHVDAASGLVWSPSHFTWMDTNYPAGTPREGYPIEIQVLWIRLLRQLAGLGLKAEGETWSDRAARAEESLQRFYWLEEQGYLSDLIIAPRGTPARNGIPDTALRSNALMAISLGRLNGERAQRCVLAALRYLVVPGALRSLAPLEVSPPLPIYGSNGQLLNHPHEPYWGRYEGDEDTRRKPAYHNGTAWTWTYPTFCEALARAWDFQPAAASAARAYLGAMDRLLSEGCLGQIPEILDGDAPHQQRGCDAQAWGVTEAIRVWKLLNNAR